jgi:hypothetical protein
MTRTGRTVLRLLPLAIALALFPAAPPLPAAPTPPNPLEKAAIRARGIEEVVDRLAAEIPAQIKSHRLLVCWMVDSTRLTRQMELHARLAARLETAFAPMADAWKEKVHLAVCSMGAAGQPAAVVAPASPDLAAAVKAVRDLGEAPDETYKSGLDAIRRVAQAMGTFAGRKLLVLVTMENGDTEDNLEETLKKLQACGVTLHVASREAVYSDPFYEARAGGLAGYYKSYDLELPYDLTGLDSPVAEYPLGWVLDRTGIHHAVPSGFGTYALTRLALATGGTYSILPVTDPGVLPFCAEAGCPLCAGGHGGCDAVYDPSRLALVAPAFGPREAYRGELGKVALARTFFQAWQIAYDAGLCAMAPPWEVKGGSLNPRGPRGARGPLQPVPWPSAQPEGIAWTGWDLDRTTHGGQGVAGDWKVEDAIRECEKAIVLLENGLRTAGLPEPSRRLVATAETLLCQLHATRFNLNQFRIVRDDLKAADAPLPAAATMGGFARPALADTRKRPAQKWNYDYRDVWLCHGGDHAADVTFLGGAPVRREQAALVERIEKNIQKYRGTPWEILSRRIGLVLIRPIAVPPPPPPDPLAPKEPKEPKPVKKPKGPDAEPPPRPPFTPPVRPPRPFRGSTLTAPGGGPADAGAAEEKRTPAPIPTKP